MMAPKDLKDLTIQQDERYAGDDWWSWSLQLDGPKRALDDVEYVEYTLHPTFANPVRRVATRKNGFMLKTAGWGVFPVYVQVVGKDGTVRRMKHQLRLHYPDGRKNTE
jgi:transcription initiation factor IIF auxiliary subunit